MAQIKSRADYIYEVAQESSRHHYLLLLLVNDFPNSTRCLPRLFEDDTCLVISNKQPSLLEIQINEGSSKVLT